MAEREYVTKEECKEYRAEMNAENKKQNEQLFKMNGEIKGLTENIKNLVAQNKWFMGIISSVLAGLMVWLIQKG